MSYPGRLQEKGKRDKDIEGQVTTNGDDFGHKRTKIERILHPEGWLLRSWNILFAASCVFAVVVDPLFFYVPVINGGAKCMSLDKRLNVITISLRSLTDFIYLLNIVLQFICPYIDEASRKLGRTKIVTDPRQIAKRYFFSGNFIIDILAVLPVPQVLFPIMFSKIKSKIFLDERKLLDAVIFLQYIPRVLRIYITWMNLTKTSNRLATWGLKAGFNLLLYILASHVLGAFWYLFSIQRETACWHITCKKNGGCASSIFNCNPPFSGTNRTLLKDYCSAETSDGRGFDFGMFSEALKSNTLESRDFPRKIAYCFWWGLRNLSSLGQNLQTSTYFWENCFAVTISIFGLLLFLLFVGNIQTYFQLATQRSEEIVQRMRVKEREIELWMLRNQLPSNLKQEIMPIVQCHLEETKDVDVSSLLSHLPIELGRKIKRHICLPLIKKVPQLERKDEQLLQLICEYLKPVYYNERSYIVREGEPLDAMLFITQGIVWNFATGNGVRHAKYIEGGNFYGEELLDWGFKDSATPNLSELPISSRTAKTHTKVEAFALMANDLRTIISKRAEVTFTVKETVVKAVRRFHEKKNESSIQFVKKKEKIEVSPLLLEGNRSTGSMKTNFRYFKTSNRR